MPAFVHSPRLSAAVRGTSFAGLVHVTDWVPTLVMGAAGMDTGADEDKFDGYNLWTAFNDEAGTSPRKVRDLNEVNIKLIEQRKTNDESRPFSFYSSHSSCSLPFFYLLSLPPSLPPSLPTGNPAEHRLRGGGLVGRRPESWGVQDVHVRC